MSKKNKSTVLLEHYLKRLRLPTILREYESMAVVCRKVRSDFITYLLRLIERELLDREKRAAERRIKQANFPVVKTIDTYDFKAQPSINEQLVGELMRCEYIDKKENVIPGLYAVGFDAGGMYGDSYHVKVASGSSVGFAFNSGRLAGKSAVKYLKTLSD